MALAINVLEFDGQEVLYETAIVVPTETDEHTPVNAGKVVVQLWEEMSIAVFSSETKRRCTLNMQ